MAPSLPPYLVSCSLICWRVTDSFGELLVIDFVLPHVSEILWSRRGKWEEEERIAWGMRSTENGTANSGFNYSQLFKLHLKWSIWGRLAIKLTNFLFAAVCRTSSLSPSFSLSFSLFLFSFLFLFFPVLLKSFCWSVARILCDFSQERHEHKHFWCASTQTIHTHSHTVAHTRTACAHLKTLVKDSYRIRTH